ncbi:MAG: hypothetical protein EAZ81_05640 [Verrucomicrobia bacterium]|nr:MAG: hypothetical protein EAZ81_05640 [Verrucomicrobiota bacterium]
MPTVIRLAGLWVIWCIWAHLAGWGLSALSALHARGYLLLLPLLVLACVIFWRKTAAEACASYVPWRKWFKRMKTSPAWMAWCVVVILVLIGALCHAPSNYDGITYRLPRLLYWLQENRWHWIQGLDHRQNVSGLGHEWMITPIIAITRSDRALFLINFVPYLLLPGLFYIAACGLGIRSRVAAWWMCIVPLAYGITLQAGSIGNDLLPMALGLAALAFAAQARKSYPILCLAFSLLSAAAMTGAKATSIPLALPIGLYWIWVAWQTVQVRGVFKSIALALPWAIPSSIIPLAVACIIHTGHWSGNPGNRYGAEAGHPVAGIVGNSLQIIFGVIQPPVFPAANKLEAKLRSSLENDRWYEWLSHQCTGSSIALGGELPMEELSGLGAALGLMILVSIIIKFSKRRYGLPISRIQWVILISSIFSILLVMSKMGTGGMARLSMPYIPLLIMNLLFGLKTGFGIKDSLVKKVRLFPAACILPALVLNPNRPLFPLDTLTHSPYVPESYQERIATVYQAYQQRAHILAPLLEGIPTSATIGFAGSGNHSALGLFKPYGTRKVKSLTPANEDQVDWVVAIPEMLEKRMNQTSEEWEAKGRFDKVSEKKIISLAAVGAETWIIYKKKVLQELQK